MSSADISIFTERVGNCGGFTFPKFCRKKLCAGWKAKGDHRGLIADRQEWVKGAPISILIVADETKFGSNDARAKVTMGTDAGIVSENINLFCAGMGFVTRPRMSMDVPAIKKLLKFSESEVPLLNNPVGYSK